MIPSDIGAMVHPCGGITCMVVPKTRVSLAKVILLKTDLPFKVMWEGEEASNIFESFTAWCAESKNMLMRWVRM